MDKNGNKTSSDKEMADILNEFFCSVFSRGDHAAPNLATPTVPPIRNLKVTKAMVLKKIEGLRADAAAGPDGIGPRLLQELKNEVAEPLTEIFNTSLETGSVPEDWK